MFTPKPPPISKLLILLKSKYLDKLSIRSAISKYLIEYSLFKYSNDRIHPKPVVFSNLYLLIKFFTF